MVLTESLQTGIGSPAADFSLKGIDEKTHTLDEFKDVKILVMIFMCNHCPYVQACIERLIKIQKDYEKSKVRLIGINSNESKNYPEDSFENMKKFAAEHEMNFPYLHDDTQEVARSYNAVCTPDIFIYDQSHTLQYHGRLDDNWKNPEKAVSHDLRRALDDLLKNKKIDWEQSPSMGCSIKWKEKNNYRNASISSTIV